MDHARNLAFMLCLYRNTVTAVSHGDDSILQIGAGTAVYNGIELAVDLVIGIFHGAAHLTKPGTRVVRNLLLGEDTAPYLSRQRGQGLKYLKHAVQGVGAFVLIFFSGVCLGTVCIFQKGADSQQFSGAQGASHFQAL